MQASLPLDKLQHIRETMRNALQAVSLTKRELLSLLGHFNFAMRSIPQGRSFISRLLDLFKSWIKLHDIVTLDTGCRSDFRFWSLLCDKWDGISFFFNDITETSVALSFLQMRLLSLVLGGSLMISGLQTLGQKNCVLFPPIFILQLSWNRTPLYSA